MLTKSLVLCFFAVIIMLAGCQQQSNQSSSEEKKAKQKTADSKPTPQKSEIFNVRRILNEKAHNKSALIDVVKASHMEVRLKQFLPGDTGPQITHQTDVLFYVVRGQGKVNIEDKEEPLKTGTILFIPKGANHRFHSITERMVLLVVVDK